MILDHSLPDHFALLALLTLSKALRMSENSVSSLLHHVCHQTLTKRRPVVCFYLFLRASRFSFASKVDARVLAEGEDPGQATALPHPHPGFCTSFQFWGLPKQCNIVGLSPAVAFCVTPCDRSQRFTLCVCKQD